MYRIRFMQYFFFIRLSVQGPFIHDAAVKRNGIHESAKKGL
jgi:hypothetical protein